MNNNVVCVTKVTSVLHSRQALLGDVGGRMFYLMPPNVGMCVL